MVCIHFTEFRVITMWICSYFPYALMDMVVRNRSREFSKGKELNCREEDNYYNEEDCGMNVKGWKISRGHKRKKRGLETNDH